MIVKIAVDKTAYHFDQLFDYLVPDEFWDKIIIGCRVLVPFGKGNTPRQGLVLEVCNKSDYENIKPLLTLIDEKPVLNVEMIETAKFLVETTFCTWYDAVRTVLPRGMNYDVSKGALKRLVGDTVDRMLTLNPELDGELPELTPKQQKVVTLLSENGEATAKEVCYLCGITDSVIKTLIIKNIVVQYERKVFRNPYAENDTEIPKKITLTENQQKVMDGVLSQIDENKPSCALLHGITGSGKTQIFLSLIEKTLKAGKTAIMLVPEIALTPQMMRQFKQRFGKNAAVLHSALSMGEKLDEWERIYAKQAGVVVGTRSAIFAPLENIGLIILDEEGEHSYKSEASPRYHAREVAKFRCAANNAVLLLASATPSIETYYYAKIGRYKLYELNERYKGAVLPTVSIVDLRLDDLLGNSCLISEILRFEINENLARKEQVLLLLNRRGFNAFAACSDCSVPVKCPNCSVSLTYHKTNGCMMCHYCGYVKSFSPQPENLEISAKKHQIICTDCGGDNIKLWGMGTQRIQEELDTLFPDANILRIDANTVTSRYDFEQKFRLFSQGKYDIMIGTQMIAKGLDFPNVTLVGVLAIDQLLYAGDYKSPERVFSLLTQVVGRSGRAEKQGRAFIQTYTPQHPVVNYAAMQNYKKFYKEEIGIRKSALNPPFCDIYLIGISGVCEERTQNAMDILVQILSDEIKNITEKMPLRILGPSKAPIYRLNNKYRFRILIKCKNNSRLRTFIRQILITAGKQKEFKDINLYADKYE